MLTYIFTYTYILTWGTTGKITLNAFATSSIFCIALLLSVSRKLVSPGNSQRATRSMTIGRNSLIIGKVYGGAKRHCESLSSTADFATFSGLHAYCSKIFVSSNWFSARIELWKWRTVPGRSIARGLYRSSSTRSIMVVIGTSFSIAAVDRTPGQDLSSKGTKKKIVCLSQKVCATSQTQTAKMLCQDNEISASQLEVSSFSSQSWTLGSYPAPKVRYYSVYAWMIKSNIAH